MVKSSFALDSDKENDEFGRKYIPEEFVWMTLNKGEGPFSPISTSIPILSIFHSS